MDNDGKSNDQNTSDKTPWKKMKAEVRSLSSGVKQGSDDNKQEDRDDNRQAFYAGGSVSSGQQILGGPSIASSTASDIMNMIRTAKSLSSVEESISLESEEMAFSRPGQRLGVAGEQSQIVTGGPTSAQATGNLTDMVLRIWSDGFTVDDGPLRTLDNPRDIRFLTMITNGIAPQEMITDGVSTAIRLKVEDHSFEMYSRMPVKPKPFSGDGHQLGSTMSDREKKAAQGQVESELVNEEQPAVEVDKTKPVTRVQVRLIDGRRFQIELNYNHTIGDVRECICRLGAQYSSGNFTLVSSFPTRELNDNSLTVEQAGILNSSILIRCQK